MGSLIRFMAVAISVIVVIGFAMFAVDEADKGSKAQQARIDRDLGTTNDPIAPSAREEALREGRHSAIRETVDDVNDVLLSPFVDLVDSENAWVNHGIPALLALLIYGVGLGFLANMLPRERHHGSDWRAASS